MQPAAAASPKCCPRLFARFSTLRQTGVVNWRAVGSSARHARVRICPSRSSRHRDVLRPVSAKSDFTDSMTRGAAQTVAQPSLSRLMNPPLPLGRRGIRSACRIARPSTDAARGIGADVSDEWIRDGSFARARRGVNRESSIETTSSAAPLAPIARFAHPELRALYLSRTAFHEVPSRSP